MGKIGGSLRVVGEWPYTRGTAVVRGSKHWFADRVGRGGWAAALLWLGCGEPGARPEASEPPPPVGEVVAAEPGAACPAKAKAPARMPRIRPEHETLEYWVGQAAAGPGADAPVMSRAAIERLDAMQLRPGEGARYDLLGPVDAAAVASQIETRFAFLRGKIEEGKYVNADGSAPDEATRRRFGPVGTLPPLEPELRVALDMIPVRCGPQTAGLFTPSLDLAFDRNLCSMIRPQEPVQVLMRWSDELSLARTSYVIGWIPSGAALSPPVPAALRSAFVRGPFLRAGREVELRADDGEVLRAPFAALLPAVPGGRGRVHAATGSRFVTAAPGDAAALASSERPLTRRSFLTDAFAYLGGAYGWGGYKGGRDCSRFLMDLFAGFGILLPRHSSDQAAAGEVIEVPAGLDDAARTRMIDDAHRRGIVLLHFPNHIMLYLGRDADGVPMALHSFAEYLVPCEGRKPEMAAGELETLYTVDRVLVSDLELGRGSSRGAFIERITKITVFSGS